MEVQFDEISAVHDIQDVLRSWEVIKLYDKRMQLLISRRLDENH